MTAHDRHIDTLTRQAIPAAPARPPAGSTILGLEKLARRLVVFMPRGAEIDALVERVRKDLHGVASSEVVHRVVSHNPGLPLGHRATRPVQRVVLPAEGLMAFLMLNRDGHDAAFRRHVRRRQSLICRCWRSQKRKACRHLYLGAPCARRSRTAAISLVMEKMNTPLYRDVDIYARAVTPEGVRYRCGHRVSIRARHSKG